MHDVAYIEEITAGFEIANANDGSLLPSLDSCDLRCKSWNNIAAALPWSRVVEGVYSDRVKPVPRELSDKQISCCF